MEAVAGQDQGYLPTEKRLCDRLGRARVSEDLTSAWKMLKAF